MDGKPGTYTLKYILNDMPARAWSQLRTYQPVVNSGVVSRRNFEMSQMSFESGASIISYARGGQPVGSGEIT